MKKFNVKFNINVKIKTYTYQIFEKDVNKFIQILRNSKFKPKTLVAIATGGLTFGTKLKNKLNIPLAMISAVSYNGYKQNNLIFNISFTKPIKSPILLIDDICDSGFTMYVIYRYFIESGYTVKTVTLFYKEKSIFKPNWYLHKIPDNMWIKFKLWE